MSFTDKNRGYTQQTPLQAQGNQFQAMSKV